MKRFCPNSKKKTSKQRLQSSEFMDICLTTLEDITRAEIDQAVTPPTQGTSSQQVYMPTLTQQFKGERSTQIAPPSFNGKFKKWSTFWDSFDSPIYSNQSLTHFDKFCERHCGALLQPQSMDWACLVQITMQLWHRWRPGIINAHMDALVNLPAVENARNLQTWDVFTTK